MAKDWKSLVDQLLQDAREAGAFENLPNAGQPLKVGDDPHTPSDMKLAHKILKDHDFEPEWIMMGKDVDALRDRLLNNMRKGARAYRGALADADRSADSFERRQRAESTLNQARQAWEQAAERLNREILRYNLKVPSAIPHRAMFDVERELKRLLQQ